jgi:hypothetical protein
MKSYASNDKYIEQFLADELYKVDVDGTVWTRKSTNGISLLKDGNWRAIKLNYHNSPASDYSYAQIPYTVAPGTRHKRNRVFLSLHRVIYRKFIGPLHPKLVVDHLDGDSLNNLPSNLELITQEENINRGKINKQLTDSLRGNYAKVKIVKGQYLGKAGNYLEEDFTNGPKARVYLNSDSYIVVPHCCLEPIGNEIK